MNLDLDARAITFIAFNCIFSYDDGPTAAAANADAPGHVRAYATL